MIRPADPAVWLNFTRRLPKGRDLYKLQLPADLPYRGKLQAVLDYVPPDSILQPLREWVARRTDTEVLYFMTEGVTGEPSDFVITLSSLTHDALASINVGRENVFVGMNGDWALFIDHEGGLHVAGPSDLFDVLNSTK